MRFVFEGWGPDAHNGGRVRFNPGDGYQYLTTGDNYNGEEPHSPTLMASKERIATLTPTMRHPQGLKSALIPRGIAICSVSPFILKPRRPSWPNMARGIRMKLQCW